MEAIIPYVAQRPTPVSSLPTSHHPVKGSQQGKLRVLLATAGNPDRNQNPHSPLPGMKPYHIKVDSLLQAREKCLEFIKSTVIGGGNWVGAMLQLCYGATYQKVKVKLSELTHQAFRMADPLEAGKFMNVTFSREAEGVAVHAQFVSRTMCQDSLFAQAPACPDTRVLVAIS